MIITRTCDVPEVANTYIEVVFPNEYKVTTEQIKNKAIKCDSIVVGKMTQANDDFIFGIVYSPKCLYMGTLGKQFTYDIEVER